ncbi:molecular chaperone Hsp70 [Histomonas meleagridis]|uniref:molecular chaperone Hsp70 n=1 Tax=Histomonas meleagridis TaxID=135588 RepID=UPI003559C677|nr:molecular chaperone Hsp70 [Histomonas meleagridis]KAH0797776.1 molecular chaperone Hsp70 [Histomonas meleagridis]
MIPQNNKYVLGIDLGTTYSSVAVFKADGVGVISNNSSNFSTPSFVTFTDDEVYVGEEAKTQALVDLKRIVFDVKRMIGKKFNDLSIQEGMKLWPFKVVSDGVGDPLIEININDQIKHFSPEEISSYILKEMKTIAVDHLGQDVKDAIISVPAGFDCNQRLSTRKAGELAGLNVLRIVDEPTAAAIGYGINAKIDTNMKILVFDFGGGTLDVSLLSTEKNNFDVIATACDPHLGGQDIDNNIMKHLADICRTKYGTDFLVKPRSVFTIQQKIEQAKITLSKNMKYNIFCPNLCDGKDFEYTLTREEFEKINQDLFDRILDPVKRVLHDSELPKESIDEIILVGGSSKIPRVKDILSEYFGKSPKHGVDPYLAVAIGAAILGHDIIRNGGNIIRYQSVIPHDIGVETSGGNMFVLIHKNTRIPTQKSEIFTTASHYQEQVKIKVFMGDDKKTENNTLLGEFLLGNIKKAELGDPQINVIFKIDQEGILEVSAKDIETGANEKETMKIMGNDDAERK